MKYQSFNEPPFTWFGIPLLTLGLLVSMLGTLAASAQGTTYVSNLTGTANNTANITVGEMRASQFTTGTNPTGYMLNSIQVSLNAADEGPGSGSIFFYIYTDSGGVPGSSLGALSGNPNPDITGIYTYTNSGIALSPAANYWVVASANNAENTTFFWWFTSATNDASINGWGINQTTAEFGNGVSWSSASGSAFQFAVNATANPSTTIVQTGAYFQDFSDYAAGATSFSDGSQLFSDRLGTVGAVQDASLKELGLTEFGIGSTHTAFLLPDLNPGAPIYAFSVKWSSQVYGIFTNGIAADGFSFNFGQLAALNLVDTVFGAQEAGYSTGLCFSVQTYVGNNPGFFLRLNGNVIASVTNNPLTEWGVSNATRHFFEADWNYNSGMSVSLDGTKLFANVPMTGFTPQAGDRFVWGARCGGYTEEVRLDNITVRTGGNLVQIPTTSPYYSGYDTWAYQPAAFAFDGNFADNSFWLTFTPNGYIGATVSPAQVVAAYVLTSGSLRQSTDPLTWLLQGSNDGGTTWTTCAGGGDRFLALSQTRSWLTTNSTAYGAYILNITANNGDIDTTLGELRLYQFSPFRPVIQPASLSGSRSQFRWPNADPAFYLESTTNLTLGGWVSNAIAPALSNNVYSLILTNNAPARFFRLHKP